MTDTTPAEGLPLVHLVRAPLTPPPPGAQPPLLALAHGVGSNERDLFGLAPQLDPRCVVVSVRAPLTRAPGAYAWFTVEFTPQGTVIAPEQLDASRRRYADFVRAAVAAYGADPARVYTLGFSQGAIISLVTALTHPKLFAGVIALAGRIPSEATPWLAAPEETAGLPIFMAHGTSDTIIRVEEARAAREILQRQRADLTYLEYPIDHRISQPMFAEMTAWLGRSLDGDVARAGRIANARRDGAAYNVWLMKKRHIQMSSRTSVAASVTSCVVSAAPLRCWMGRARSSGRTTRSMPRITSSSGMFARIRARASAPWANRGAMSGVSRRKGSEPGCVRYQPV